MPYRYLDDIATADIAFEAWGDTLGELFAASAEAVLNVMVENPDSIVERERLTIQCEADSREMLLCHLLEELIYYKDAERLFLKLSDVVIESRENSFILTAKAHGELIDPERHELNVDVKAVTLHRFALEMTEHGWTATVVLDI